MEKIIPIFIMGENRNGTTNLGNSISSFSNISSITHELHWGSHETDILSKQKYFMKIKNINQYMKFLSMFLKSDLFIIANTDESILYKKKYDNFYELFFEVMDEHTKNNNNTYWVTKLSPSFCNNKKEYQYFIDLVLNRYEDYKLICIERNVYSVMKSYLNMQNASKRRKNILLKYFAVLANCMSQAYNYQFYKKEINNKNGIYVVFEDYIKNKEKVMRKIADYLKIDYDKEFNIKNNYVQNSSFFTNKKIVKISKKYTLFAYKISLFLVKILPGLARLIGRYRNNKMKDIDIFYYRLYALKYMRDYYLDDIKTREPSLYKLIMQSYKKE